MTRTLYKRVEVRPTIEQRLARKLLTIILNNMRKRSPNEDLKHSSYYDLISWLISSYDRNRFIDGNRKQLNNEASKDIAQWLLDGSLLTALKNTGIVAMDLHLFLPEYHAKVLSVSAMPITKNWYKQLGIVAEERITTKSIHKLIKLLKEILKTYTYKDGE